MKIILTNGAELAPISVTGAPRRVQGASRDALTFVFPGDAGLDALDGLFTEDNCRSVTIRDDEGGSHIYTDYVLRCELSKSAVEVSPATPDSEAVYEERITVTMAQLTYAEKQMAALQAAVAALQKG